LIGVMVPVFTDAEIRQAGFGKRLQPQQGIRFADGKVAVCYHAHIETHFRGFLHPGQQERVVEKGLSPFEVNDLHTVQFGGLAKRRLDLLQIECAPGAGTAVKETVIAFVSALVGQQKMKSFDHVLRSLAFQLFLNCRCCMILT
jgi:hypothetical protein